MNTSSRSTLASTAMARSINCRIRPWLAFGLDARLSLTEGQYVGSGVAGGCGHPACALSAVQGVF